MTDKTEDKSCGWRENIQQFIMTTGIIGTLITSVVSLYVAFSNNAKLEELEKQKYQYAMQENRFEKLHESLEYFSRFQIYDPKYIERFDINSDEYTFAGVKDMLNDSVDEFRAQILILYPYLSKESRNYLKEEGILGEDEIKTRELKVENIYDDAVVNASVKEYLNLANEDFSVYSMEIITAITHDIYKEYDME